MDSPSDGRTLHRFRKAVAGADDASLPSETASSNPTHGASSGLTLTRNPPKGNPEQSFSGGLRPIERKKLWRLGRVVYVIQAGNGLLKFGCTRDLFTRISNLQSMSPDKMHCVAWAEGDPCQEAALHLRLVDHVHHGEWFNPTPEVLAVVANFKRIVAKLRRAPNPYGARYRLRDLRRELRAARQPPTPPSLAGGAL